MIFGPWSLGFILILMTFPVRAKSAHNAVAKQLYELMDKKQSNLALALDVVNSTRFFEILEKCGDRIVILKTHTDCIDDFNDAFISRLLSLKERYGFIILEDRKFADIGNTVKLQYESGVCRIIEWADLVTAHIFPGAALLEGLRQAWRETGYERGCLLIPEMTSRDHLFTQDTAKKAMEYAKEYSDFVAGFIAPAGMRKIFSSDYFLNPELASWFRQLVGIEGSKPFECVGTIEESKLAALLAIRQYQRADESIPPVLYENMRMVPISEGDFHALEHKLLSDWSDEHFLPGEYKELLRKVT